jgi:polysaccharide deacetylase family sporulation protein PdaB
MVNNMRNKMCFIVVYIFSLLSLVLAKQGPIYPAPYSFDSIIDYRFFESLQQGINTHIIWAGSKNNRNIALTFDDGPNAKYTPQILKILEQNNIRATFFLIGQHAQKYPELVKQIKLAGHEIGNHTYSHVRLTKVPSVKIKQELEKTRDIVLGITGENTYLFRPPWGIFDNRSLAELAMRKFDAVLWSVDSRDWSRPGVAVIKKNVLSTVRNGSIILCHDDHDQIVAALPDMIKSLKEHGYQFVTVPELMAASQ